MVEKFYPVRKNGKYAFIDNQGKLLTKFDFDFANIFGGILVNGEYGYLDCNGNIFMNPQYKYGYGFGGFYENLAVVEINGKFGFINRENYVVIEPKYYKAHDFHNGIAIVKDDMFSSDYFINTKGEKILTGKDFTLSEYNEGLINCKTLEEKKWGFIDINNNFIIPPIYDYARFFSEGLAQVQPTLIGKKPNKKQFSGFINKYNEIIISPKFKISNGQFSEGLCCIWENGNGYIDTKGDIVIPCEYLVGEDFSESLASVQLKNTKKWGFINKNGEMVIKPKFAHTESFENGIAEVIIGEHYDIYKYGYINKNGDYIWKPTR